MAVRVLVVNDDVPIRDLFRQALEEEGYTTSGARDGVEALDLLRTSPHRLVVLVDNRMPRMDGLELLRLVVADVDLRARHAYVFTPWGLLDGEMPPGLQRQLDAVPVPTLPAPVPLDRLFDAVRVAAERLGSKADPDG